MDVEVTQIGSGDYLQVVAVATFDEQFRVIRVTYRMGGRGLPRKKQAEVRVTNMDVVVVTFDDKGEVVFPPTTTPGLLAIFMPATEKVIRECVDAAVKQASRAFFELVVNGASENKPKERKHPPH